MAICPDCGREFYLVDEDELEVGDLVDCEECGAALEVVHVNELELTSYTEAEPETLAEEPVLTETDDDPEFEEIPADEFDDNGYYGSE